RALEAAAACKLPVAPPDCRARGVVVERLSGVQGWKSARKLLGSSVRSIVERATLKTWLPAAPCTRNDRSKFL
nr:hypothetical protein [Tanacetum cinerariifolium]